MRYGGGGEPCDACGKTVYLAERVLANRCTFHKGCLKCSTCGKKLTVSDWFLEGTTIYCKAHLLHKRKSEPEVAGRTDASHSSAAVAATVAAPSTTSAPAAGAAAPCRPRGMSFGGGGERCCRCEKTVYAAERATADGGVWHKNCFRCTTCGTLLGPSGWGKDAAGALYCHSHHAQLLKASGMKVEGGDAQREEARDTWTVRAHAESLHAPPPQPAPRAPPPLPHALSPPPPPPPPGAWSQYFTPDGRAYFNNAQTGETTWEAPPGWQGAPQPLQHAGAAPVVATQGHCAAATAAAMSVATLGDTSGDSGSSGVGGPTPWDLLPSRDAKGEAKPISSAAQAALRHLLQTPLPSEGSSEAAPVASEPLIASAAPAATTPSVRGTSSAAADGLAPWEALLHPKVGAVSAGSDESEDPAAARREAARAALRELRGLGSKLD